MKLKEKPLLGDETGVGPLGGELANRCECRRTMLRADMISTLDMRFSLKSLYK